MSRLLVVAVLALLNFSAATGAEMALDRYTFEKATLRQWKLPKKLREISGLAFHRGRLYTHDDQLGIVYEIDYDAGKLGKAFALGNKTVRDDFEGIAAAGDTFYMLTSDGALYEFGEGDNGERVSYRRYRTSLGRRCELEGLVHDAKTDKLLLVCKEPRSDELEGKVTVYSWSPQRRSLDDEPFLEIELQALTDQIPGKKFNPSGIEIDPRTGHLMLVAARQRALAEVDRSGRVLRAFTVPLAGRHRQTEGLALLDDGRLVLADEGGSKRARLAIYQASAP